MRNEVKVLLFVFALAFFLALGGYFIRRMGGNGDFDFLTPLSDTFSLSTLFGKREKPKYIVYGYLPYWSLENVKYLQFDKLTDISYFGLHIDSQGNFRRMLEAGETEQGYNKWKNSKTLDKLIKDAKWRDVRVSLTVISHVDEISDRFLNCRSCWDNFSKNLIDELKSKNIKDVNLNFEYSGLTEPEMADKYTLFVQFINFELDKNFGDSFVVVSTFADSLVKPRVTKIEDLAKVADAIFIMAYDFHRPNSDFAGPVAPINGKGVYAEYDIQTMFNDYLAAAPANKLILGVPYYGYNWVVAAVDPNAQRVPGNDDIGYSQSQTYEQIMETILDTRPDVKWDDLAKVPYFSYTSPNTGSLRQVYFENARSLQYKYDMAKSYNFAGVGIWALGYDGGYTELWDLLD